jgi:GT2 family glycosyltransferase
MKLAIIIVNWNTRDLLAQCLESLEGSGEWVDIIVVDNASADGSTQMLRERFPQVQLIENKENLGFARANNQALRIWMDSSSLSGTSSKSFSENSVAGRVHRDPALVSIHPYGHSTGDDRNIHHPSTADLEHSERRINEVEERSSPSAQDEAELILLLNPDTLVRPGALEALIRFMLDHPHCGAAGARLLNPDGTPQISAYPFPTLLREFWRLFHLDARYPLSCYPPSRWKTDISQEVDSVQGAVLLLRQQTLDQVGLLDEDYFIFSEEVDLCQRIKSAGWEIYWLPGAEVIHYGGQSTRQVAPQMFLELYRGKVLYFRKRHNRLSAWVYKLILLLAALPRIALAPLPAYRQLASHYAQLVRALPWM